MTDPNMFDGINKLVSGRVNVTEVPLTGKTYGRGMGVLDMAQAIREGRKVRIPGELGLHVLDIMLSLQDAAESKDWVNVVSTLAPIEPLSADWDPMVATLS